MEALYSIALQLAVARSADILTNLINIKMELLYREHYKGSYDGSFAIPSTARVRVGHRE